MKDDIKFINVNGNRIKLDYVTSYNLIDRTDYYSVVINLYNNKNTVITVKTILEADMIIRDLDILFNTVITFKSTFIPEIDDNF